MQMITRFGELLHNQPNADMTAVEVLGNDHSQPAFVGNAYAEIDRTGKRITSLGASQARKDEG